jgi:plastocyanin
MKRHRGSHIAVALLALAVAGLAVSCASDPAPNSPPVVKELDSPDIGSGGTFNHVFATAGSYPYHCRFHSMSASVHVQAGHPMTAAVSITDNAFGTPTALVAPGGTVTWTNNGTNTHSVTSD